MEVWLKAARTGDKDGSDSEGVSVRRAQGNVAGCALAARTELGQAWTQAGKLQGCL